MNLFRIFPLEIIVGIIQCCDGITIIMLYSTCKYFREIIDEFGRQCWREVNQRRVTAERTDLCAINDCNWQHNQPTCNIIPAITTPAEYLHVLSKTAWAANHLVEDALFGSRRNRSVNESTLAFLNSDNMYKVYFYKDNLLKKYWDFSIEIESADELPHSNLLVEFFANDVLIRRAKLCKQAADEDDDLARYFTIIPGIIKTPPWILTKFIENINLTIRLVKIGTYEPYQPKTPLRMRIPVGSINLRNFRTKKIENLPISFYTGSAILRILGQDHIVDINAIEGRDLAHICNSIKQHIIDARKFAASRHVHIIEDSPRIDE